MVATRPGIMRGVRKQFARGTHLEQRGVLVAGHVGSEVTPHPRVAHAACDVGTEHHGPGVAVHARELHTVIDATGKSVYDESMACGDGNPALVRRAVLLKYTYTFAL